MAFEFSDIPVVGPLLAPKKPGKVSDTVAAKNVDTFAAGINNERTNLTPTNATPITEGTAAPGAHPGQTGQQYRDQAEKLKAQLDALPRDPKTGSALDQTAANRLAEQYQAAQRNAEEADKNPPDNNTYIDPAGANAQKDALGLAKGAATGLAPSQAEQLFRKGIDEGTANQLGMAATLQGSNPGMALQQGLRGAANVTTGASADAAALRADEMAKARQQYADTAGKTRGQTIELAIANMDAKQRQQTIDHAFELGLISAEEAARLAQLGPAATDVNNANNFSLAQQQFWGTLGGAAAKGAAGGGGAPA